MTQLRNVIMTKVIVNSFGAISTFARETSFDSISFVDTY